MPEDSDTSKGGSKNGKKEGLSGSSFFTWFMVIALLGVWTSVAVVWFDLVDYEQVLAKAKDFRYNFSEVLQGKLGIYDADGDGDFDIEDAKVLLGLKEKSVPVQATPEEEPEEPIQPEVHLPEESDYEHDEDEVEEIIQAQIHKTIQSQPVEEEKLEEEIVLIEEEVEEQAEDPLLFMEIEEEEERDQQQEEEPLQQEEEDEEHDEVPVSEGGHAAPEAEEALEPAEEDTEDDHYHMEAAGEEEPEPSEILDEAGGEETAYEQEPPFEEEPKELDEDLSEPEILDETEVVEEVENMEHYVYKEPKHEEEREAQETVYEELEVADEARDAAEEAEVPHYQYHHEEIIQDPATVDEEEDEAYGSQSMDVEADIQAAVPLPEPVNDDADRGGMTEEVGTSEALEEKVLHTEGDTEGPSGKNEKAVKDEKEKAKKKKPKLLNKFDKTIKTELDAAEKLRKKGRTEEAITAFEELVNKYPQSPRARYGKAQSEDDLAEKLRSNEALLKAVGTYEEVANLPNAPSDLIKLTLKKQADRQQFLGRMRGSLVTLQRLVQLFPDDISLRNDLGVGYLLLGDNSNAKMVYEEVLSLAPNDGFAKVHYGFILKAENKIAESIPYLKEGLESGDPGTDDGRFYFHLGDAMQRVGNKDAYKWYELGHQRGHFASVWQRSLYNVNGLKAQPWWTAKETGYTDLVKSLERNWKLVRDEGLAVMNKAKNLFIPEDENLREKGDWSQYTLWQQGRKNENACNAAPKTCALLEKFPESTGCKRGQIKYSVMHPGTHVWPHTGPTNCRLRMHLGLVIPKKGCQIRCANDTRSWDEGKVLIFDDSFEHEVWQDADSYRLIFIVDVWHPELTMHQRRNLPAI
ncbi:aspartyl/asparaginyl beta-hydroxylase isoform X2 [Rhinatrema bivittatum]|uniref:aspartyl/asparaginyl beta-hydroxylase isoform X2 n=1 Tax=Rhinatrema bivittatum TaxID=194408 RepID=UPI00112A126B|nr:aspartyl/asparaginyl beta-hydroxylase isoform X2 [Rhinatrema bivittatum]